MVGRWVGRSVKDVRTVFYDRSVGRSGGQSVDRAKQTAAHVFSLV